MKNLFNFMALSILLLGTQANASCLVEIKKGDVLVHDNSVLVEKRSGFFHEFADEFTKAGYDVCIGSQCKGQNVDLTFRVVLSANFEKNVLPFGYSKGQYFTALSMSLDDNQLTNSYTSKDLKGSVKKAQGILRKNIPKCALN
ncbi:MAG: hypothetical protein ACOVP4_11375 [Bacteriovoracaceae bacterium]